MSKEVVAEVIALIELGLIAPEDIVKCLRKANSEPEKALAEQPAQQEPKQSDIFCGVDFVDGLLSVSVLRRRADDVAELLHAEQIELPAQRTWVEMSDARIKGIFSYHGQFVSGKELAMLRVIETMLKENK